jgi:hypothetical protein
MTKPHTMRFQFNRLLYWLLSKTDRRYYER